jgi:hypothetical protein
LFAILRKYRRGRVLLAAVLVVILVPLPRVVLAEWAVRVVDQAGMPVSGIRVSCMWDDYSYGIGGGWDLYTDLQGWVTFPRTTLFRPILYWAGKATWTLLNLLAHASFGVRGRVWISDPKASEHSSVLCSGSGCTAARMVSEIRFVPD